MTTCSQCNKRQLQEYLHLFDSKTQYHYYFCNKPCAVEYLKDNCIFEDVNLHHQ